MSNFRSYLQLNNLYLKPPEICNTWRQIDLTFVGMSPRHLVSIKIYSKFSKWKQHSQATCKMFFISEMNLKKLHFSFQLWLELFRETRLMLVNTESNFKVHIIKVRITWYKFIFLNHVEVHLYKSRRLGKFISGNNPKSHKSSMVKFDVGKLSVRRKLVDWCMDVKLNILEWSRVK